MTAAADQTARTRTIFQEALAAHGIDRCVIVTGSFRAERDVLIVTDTSDPSKLCP